MEPGRGPTVETVCPAEHEIRALPNVRRIIVVMIHEPLHFISKGEIKGIKEKTKAVIRLCNKRIEGEKNAVAADAGGRGD